MLSQMVRFHSILWLNNIPLCVHGYKCQLYTHMYKYIVWHLFIYLLNDRHLGCFHILTIGYCK